MAWLGLVVVLAVLVSVAYVAGAGRREHRARARAVHPSVTAQIVEPRSHVEHVRRVGPYDWQADDRP